MNEPLAVHIDENEAVDVGEKVGILFAVWQTAWHALDVVEIGRLGAEVNHFMLNLAGGTGVVRCSGVFEVRIMQTAEFCVS